MAVLAAFLGLSGGCSDDRPTDPGARPQLADAAAVSLVSCPTGETRAASAHVPPQGVALGLGRHQVSLPDGAVADTTLVTLEVPASQHLRVELRANEHEHYQFMAPLTVTLDYGRCSMKEIEKGALSVWLLDDSTGALLQNMGGHDDRPSRTITFTTDHFSGYAIAN